MLLLISGLNLFIIFIILFSKFIIICSSVDSNLNSPLKHLFIKNYRDTEFRKFRI